MNAALPARIGPAAAGRVAYRRVPRRAALGAVGVPPSGLEYGYYLITTYSLLSASVGLEVRFVAAIMMLALTAICLQRIRTALPAVLGPVKFLLGAVVSFVLVQGLVHRVPPMDETIRLFVLWICGIVIMQTLQLRPGFARRCTLVIFAVGIVALPSLTFGNDPIERARAGSEIGGNLRNANGLGTWFGFCAVSLAIFGLQTRRFGRRTMYWLAAAASLGIAGLSVSRGALAGSVLGLAAAARGVLKRGVAPVVLILAIAGAASSLTVIGYIVSRYEGRAMEETGRLLLWPHVVNRIATAPLAGFSIDGISTYIPEQGREITTPHNSFLYFALAAGALPFLFWTAFWLQAGWRSSRAPSPAGPYRRALFLFALTAAMLGDIEITPWFLLACSIAAGRGDVVVAGDPKGRTLIMRRPVRAGAAPVFGWNAPVRHVRAGHPQARGLRVVRRGTER